MKTQQSILCLCDFVVELKVIANCVKMLIFEQRSFYDKFTCGGNNESYRLGAAIF